MNIDDYPYVLSDPILNEDGSIAHLGAIGTHEPPQIGTGLTTAIQFLESNIDEQGSTGQTSIPANVANETVKQVNERADDSYQMLFQNALQALRCACHTWIDAAKIIYFSNPRTLRIQNQDESFDMVKTLQYDVDQKKQEVSACVNDAKGKYDVIIKTNESFLSMKEAERQESLETLQYIDTTTEVGQMALLNVIINSTNANSKNIKKLAKVKQFEILLNNGIMPEVEDNSDSEILANLMKKRQNQKQQEDPNMVFAQAEMKKGVAQEQDSTVRAFDAETRRMKLGLDAHKQQFEVGKIVAETDAKRLEPIIKRQEQDMKQRETRKTATK